MRGRIHPFSSFILALIIVLARTAVRANVLLTALNVSDIGVRNDNAVTKAP